eukprot:TRINITY_DN11571_c0_g1_i1.p1 TRINITY_DN11571_c0_g1~~TRINITY_DN11571_c0_g1_i1.p1  ORF type:complete len:226 (+),score=74.30 TRINITY_DN11571_c0_g1_i1:157-834(+)
MLLRQKKPSHFATNPVSSLITYSPSSPSNTTNKAKSESPEPQPQVEVEAEAAPDPMSSPGIPSYKRLSRLPMSSPLNPRSQRACPKPIRTIGMKNVINNNKNAKGKKAKKQAKEDSTCVINGKKVKMPSKMEIEEMFSQLLDEMNTVDDAAEKAANVGYDDELLRNTAINSFNGIFKSERQLAQRMKLLKDREQGTVNAYRMQRVSQLLSEKLFDGAANVHFSTY